MTTALSHFLHVTWVDVGGGMLHVVARCDLCNVVAQRRLDSGNDGLAQVTAIEALAEHGCSHVSGEIASSGIRRAFVK